MTSHPRNAKRQRKREQAARIALPPDLNLQAAGLLHDMAALQPNERAQLGYKRAARAVTGLPAPVDQLVEAGILQDVPYIGPSSARIIKELVETGSSPAVESAVGRSGQQEKVARLRRFRENFLSHLAMEQVLASRQPAAIVSKALFRGDFQMHSRWSDGAETIEAMAEACLSLGHSCMGMTDHSYGLPVARGMPMASVTSQHRQIDELNERLTGRFRIFKGVEANILSDGNLDLQPEERTVFEFVVAAPHSQLRGEHDQTPRMVRAVSQPGVAILGHPRGRMYNTRAGIVADWPRVFAEAAGRGVAIEIDGNWHRQDVDFTLARQALDAGCVFALDSDAHSIPELRFTDYSIAHARLAGVPAERVINCWPDDALERWMAEKRRQA